MNDDKKQQQMVSIPQWLITGIVPVLITVGGWIWTSATLTSRVDAQTVTNQILFKQVTEAGDLAKKHETLIPLMQTDITEIKTDVKKVLAVVKPT